MKLIAMVLQSLNLILQRKRPSDLQMLSSHQVNLIKYTLCSMYTKFNGLEVHLRTTSVFIGTKLDHFLAYKSILLSLTEVNFEYKNFVLQLYSEQCY